MGKYRKEFDNQDADDESASHFKAPKFKEWKSEIENGWKNNKKKSKQFRQARKKRSLGY